MMVLLSLLLGCVGSALLGWYAHGWFCRRHNRDCPVWQQERKAAWKTALRKRYPEGRRERHPTAEALLDLRNETGAPLSRRNTPSEETPVTNPRRKT